MLDLKRDMIIQQDEMTEEGMDHGYFDDIYCKKVLSLKKVTAGIFKYFIPAFDECSLGQIIEMLESQQTSKGYILKSLNTERYEARK